MKLRFVEDRRTLVWAGVLFPLGPALALWEPQLLPWLAPLLLYCSYLSGVLSHNHNHCPVFVSRRLNLLYGAWLSFFYGFPSFAWIPSHNRNHHRFLNGHHDVSSTSRALRPDSVLAALTYPLVCSRYQLPLVIEYAKQALSHRSAQAQRVMLEVLALLGGHAGLLWLALQLHGASRGALAYGFGAGLPALLGNYWMMLTNYLQHVDCDPSSASAHSRNFVNPFWNWFVFDNGYHSVHHEQPGLHWSRYRALHHASVGRLEPSLDQDFIIAYAMRRYWPS
ncbi:MAG TPA: fatty acid desaturase [Polyangiaceae bacterium]|nr:fatty acid desaturase [Polyangiaceae bacterium]